MATPTCIHASNLLSREAIAGGTMACRFMKLADFQFRAGQSTDQTFPIETDTEVNLDNVVNRSLALLKTQPKCCLIGALARINM